MTGIEEEEEQAIVAQTDEEPTSTSKRKRKRKRKKKDEGGGRDGDKNDDDDDDEKGSKSADALPEADQSKLREVDRTVFVEGIPFVCTPARVREFFVEHISGGDDDEGDGDCIADLRLPVWHDSGRLRGYGHVVLKTAEQYKKALTLSGKYLQNRYLSISAAHAPKSASTLDPKATTADHSNPSATVAIHNLSYEASEDDVHNVMSKYGEISEGGIRIVRHSDTGRSKGFGYVQFKETSAAQKAVKTLPCVIAGRACRLDYDHGRVRGSFRTADRKLWHKEYKRPRPDER